MRIVKWGAVVVAVVLVVIVIAAPIQPMPWALISGTAADVPTSWGDTS